MARKMFRVEEPDKLRTLQFYSVYLKLYRSLSYIIIILKNLINVVIKIDVTLSNKYESRRSLESINKQKVLISSATRKYIVMKIIANHFVLILKTEPKIKI